MNRLLKTVPAVSPMARVLVTGLGLLISAALAVPARAQSQATTGEVNGRVTDAQGGTLPGASVCVLRACRK